MPKPHPYKKSDGTITWRVRFRLAPNANPVSETFTTYEAAHDFAHLVDTVGPVEARRIRDATTIHPGGLTLATAFTQYLTHVATYTEPDTPHRYRIVAEHSWLPTLGHYPINALTRAHVTAWLAKQRATPTYKGTPPAAKTLKNAHSVLSSTLQHHVTIGNLEANVAKGVKLPKATINTRPHVYLTPERFTTICAHLDGQDLFLARLLYATGMRYSEATALTPADFTLDTTPATVRVWRAWKQTPDGPRLGTPKTRKSERTITLPATFAREAAAYLATLPRMEQLFIGADGGILPNRTWREVWYAACARAGVEPRPTIHDLRHSHASELIRASVPLPIIQDRLGHESVQTTVDTYGHLAADAGNLAAVAIDNALNGQ